MKKYVIYSKCLSNGFEDIVDEKTYNELSQSKEILFEARSKENIYNIILMNYYEFEQELFKILLNNEIFNSSYQNFNDYSSKIEQRILNLLSAITLYMDSFKFEESIEKYPKSLINEFAMVDKYIKNTQKNDKKIKIMKFLRNHIQHNGLLIENFSLNGVNLTDKLREQTVKFHMDKNKIKANWFKVENFIDIEDEIDLKKSIREYMDFISNVHSHFREVTNMKILSSRESFEDIIKKYDKYKYLFVAEKDNTGKVDEISILLDWDNVRIEMTNKNRVPKSFKRHSINTK